MEIKETSRFLKRFRKNKFALASFFVICIMVFIALFAYVLAPDNTENCDMRCMEIATKSPGYKGLFIKKYHDTFLERKSLLARVMYGEKNNFVLIPIKKYKIKGDSIFAEHILDDANSESVVYAINQLISPSLQGDKFDVEDLIIRRTFWLGTDLYGRDMLSRLLVGTRISMAVGFIAVILSIIIGLFLGSFSGYFGGWVDQIITWLINVVWAIPTLLLVFAITFALGKGFWQIFIAVGLTMWVGTARLIRGQVLSIKELEYVQAAKTMGFSSLRIIVKHILPNVMGPTIVLAASNFATAILIEAGLSFLGIGIQPPASSWGLMIKENYNFIITNRPMLAIFPGIAIMIIVLAFNLLGNALRDALDVKGKI